MSKKLVVSIISLFVFILFTGCNNTNVQVQTIDGLKIYSWSSSLGGVNENDLDKTKFSYYINLTNGNEKTIVIKSPEFVYCSICFCISLKLIDF